MTNKFLKTFGICVMIILLPVLIAVSVVCLREDTNQNNNSYTVYSDYAEATKLEYKEGDDSWVFISIPVRKYYSFVGVKVDGVQYDVVDKKVQLADDAQKDAFKKAIIEDKREISAVWECDYSIIWVENNYPSEDCFDIAGGDSAEVDLKAYAIETQGIFTCLGYVDINDTELGVSTKDMTEIIINVNNEDKTIKITENDLTNVNGNSDITIKTILDKLEAEGVSLDKNSNNEATIKLKNFNFKIED